ncbi:MAG: TRASH domain-containing protein [Candidatus Omnitrophota bacterium]
MKVLSLLLMGALLLTNTPASLAYHHEGQGATAQTPSTAVDAGNKICPVSGEEIGGMGEGVSYEYNGKVYKLCCLGCLKDFQKNPEKFSRIAEESLKK